MNESNHDQMHEKRDQVKLRKEKLKQLEARGFDHPNQVNLSHQLSEVLACAEDEASLSTEKTWVIAGRMMARRLMGKASFCHIQDGTAKLQIYCREKELGEQYASFLDADLGDILRIEGHLFKTKVGELTLWASRIDLLVKSLHPLPDKFHGLTDKELCYRRRYLDIMVNESSRQRFKDRSAIIHSIRDYLVSQSFLEVETPMMQAVASGANAKPFVTHHNAMHMDLNLRIAPELNLKRLVVGGMDRVFEINRNFRNEGLSSRHNPEFTMLECYQAYTDYEDAMNLTEALIRAGAESVSETGVFNYQGETLDFNQPMARLTMVEAIAKLVPLAKDKDLSQLQVLRELCEKLNITTKAYWDEGECQLAIFESEVEAKLIQPCFITQYPTSVSPLARRNKDNPKVTDRFELFIAGVEIANGFSELNDAQDQQSRFERQMQAKAEGDEEAMSHDDDYILALEYGLPPTAGLGIGIDRLVMLLTDASSIRDVILFPLLRN